MSIATVRTHTVRRISPSALKREHEAIKSPLAKVQDVLYAKSNGLNKKLSVGRKDALFFDTKVKGVKLCLRVANNGNFAVDVAIQDRSRPHMWWALGDIYNWPDHKELMSRYSVKGSTGAYSQIGDDAVAFVKAFFRKKAFA